LCKAQNQPGPPCELIRPLSVVHLFVIPLYIKLRTSPLDTGQEQAVHLLVEVVELGRRKALFSTRLDRLIKIALRLLLFLGNESLESRETPAAVKGPPAAPGTVFSQGGFGSCGLQESIGPIPIMTFSSFMNADV
jgi:hypothetical protein